MEVTPNGSEYEGKKSPTLCFSSVIKCISASMECVKSLFNPRVIRRNKCEEKIRGKEKKGMGVEGI